MLDLVYLLAIVALFALVALIAKGVEKLGAGTGPSPRPDVTDGGERS